MRYSEIKESNLAPGPLQKYPERIQTFLNKIKNKDPFTRKDGSTVIIDPSEYDRLVNLLNHQNKASATQIGKLKVLDSPDTVQPGNLKKTKEFGGQQTSSTTDEIKYNRGEVVEGYHALTAFLRLIARPSRDITLPQVQSFFPKINNGQTLILKAKEVENKDIADEFHVTIKLKPASWEAFVNPQILGTDKLLNDMVTDIIDDANDETARYADQYAVNGRFDYVRVIGDGVSGETEKKTDIEFENETEKKFRGYSIKAGTTKQIHQVGGGAIKDSPKGKTATPEERYNILQDDLFGVHGEARLADISSVKSQIIKAASTADAKGRLAAQAIAYTAAVSSINQFLTTDDNEKTYLLRLIKALKYWMTKGDDNVKLKQFTGKGTIILDARELDKMHQQEGLDLIAESKKATRPQFHIKDKTTGKKLITFRTYFSDGYIRNYLEKGDLFVELTNIAKKRDK